MVHRRLQTSDAPRLAHSSPGRPMPAPSSSTVRPAMRSCKPAQALANTKPEGDSRYPRPALPKASSDMVTLCAPAWYKHTAVRAPQRRVSAQAAPLRMPSPPPACACACVTVCAGGFEKSRASGCSVTADKPRQSKCEPGCMPQQTRHDRCAPGCMPQQTRHDRCAPGCSVAAPHLPLNQTYTCSLLQWHCRSSPCTCT